MRTQNILVHFYYQPQILEGITHFTAWCMSNSETLSFLLVLLSVMSSGCLVVGTTRSSLSLISLVNIKYGIWASQGESPVNLAHVSYFNIS